jgi:hydrogenase maturation protein HypF
VLGVAWDGTGYGTDGTVWGGEFLRANRHSFTRFAHLRTFRLPGGDAAAREPRRAALGLLHEIGGMARVAGWFKSAEFQILGTALAQGLNAPVTSSMGRLFDAVAALVGLHTDVQFEGQAAMELEFAAGDLAADHGYSLVLRDGVLDWEPAVRALLADLDAGASAALISARFHRGLAESIVMVARAAGLPHVALGGGCFQNVRLLEESVAALRAGGFTPWWPQRVPPNDGGIAFGQAALRAYPKTGVAGAPPSTN